MTLAEDNIYTRGSAWGFDNHDDPETAWMKQAVCPQIDPELWFPEKAGTSRPAKRICNTCPVRDKCLEYALKHDLRGIWGGMSEQERRRLQRGQEPFRSTKMKLPVDDGGHGYHKYRRGCKCSVCKAGYADVWRAWNHLDKPAKLCKTCGGEIHGQGRHTYCSADCRAQARPAPTQNRKPCAHCHTEFSGNRTAQYCSTSCRVLACRARARQRKAQAA